MAVQGDIFDITIVGGGPTGLFAAFYAGLRLSATKIVESQDHLGGQLTTLYPDKFIYDVAGYPAVLARTLAGELIRQAANYHPVIVLSEEVQEIRRRDDGLLELQTQTGRHLSRTILIAVGGGAFTPKRLPDPALQAYEGNGLEYFLMDISDYRRKAVLVVGGGDSAVDWALLLKRVTDRVTLIHRRDRFRAHEDSVAKLNASGVQVRLFHELKALHGHGKVEAATIVDNRTHTEELLAIDAALVSVGFASSLGPIHGWGLELQADGIVVSSRMETSLPGVFAAGDITAYPGKLKLLATAFGEAAAAVNHAKVFISPASPVDPGHSTSVVPRQREAARQQAAIIPEPADTAGIKPASDTQDASLNRGTQT